MRNLDYYKKLAFTTTVRLASSYLVIIMIMSIGFSVVFYNISSQQLGRQLPPASSFGVNRFSDLKGPGPRVDTFFAERIEQGRDALLQRLVALNLLALISGTFVSYYLARRTLRPIERNVEAQSQFVSDASHELRTPLTSLQTMNEVALRQKKLTTSQAREVLANNVQEVEKLKQLTTALLDMARQDATTLQRVPTLLTDVVSDALNAIVTTAQTKNISVDDTVEPVSVNIERASIAQVMTIIVDNAIKYSPPGSTIYVTSQSSSKSVRVQVRDTGIGISKQDLPYIFDRFYRADQARSKTKAEGYGIGLALARKIVARHHGTVTVNCDDRGTIFTVVLPK